MKNDMTEVRPNPPDDPPAFDFSNIISLSHEIKRDELEKVMQNLKKTSAPGLDQIDYQTLKKSQNPRLFTF